MKDPTCRPVRIARMSARCYIAFVVACAMVVPIILFVETTVPDWYVAVVLVMSLVSAALIVLGSQEMPLTKHCPRCAHWRIEEIHIETAAPVMMRCCHCGACWHPEEK